MQLVHPAAVWSARSFAVRRSMCGSSRGKGTKKLRRSMRISSCTSSSGRTSRPFSRTTTRAPARASSNATGLPPAPLPTTTTSADSFIVAPLARSSAPELREAGGPARVGPEADQAPAGLVAIAAVRRIAERALEREVREAREEAGRAAGLALDDGEDLVLRI